MIDYGMAWKITWKMWNFYRFIRGEDIKNTLKELKRTIKTSMTTSLGYGEEKKIEMSLKVKIRMQQELAST